MVHTNYRFMSFTETVNRLDVLNQRHRNLMRQVSRLKEKIALAAQNTEIVLDEESVHLIRDTITSNVVIEHFKDLPRESFQNVFWQQQALRESGCIKLPSQRTLRDYTHYTKASLGFSSEGDQMLRDAARLDWCPEREKYVILLLDEMHIRQDLVFDKHTGNLIGFTNLGDISDHLSEFEQTLQDDGTTLRHLAKTMLVFMVRGLFSKLQFPYVQFSCTSLTEQKEVTVEVVLKNCPMISPCLSVTKALAKKQQTVLETQVQPSVHVHGNLLKGIYALLEDKSFLLPTRPAQFVLNYYLNGHLVT
ncbi:hypothetical protein EMCRGX_G025254 [Ephydatia muelleri]